MAARVARLYPGWSAAVAYDVPYAAVQLTCLDALTSAVGRYRRRRAAGPGPGAGESSGGGEAAPAPPPPPRLGGGAAAVVGAATGAITSVLTEPLDVVRTRAMTAAAVDASASAAVRAAARRTPWAAAVAIARAEGVATLWRGTAPRLVSVTAASAVWYTVYEGVRRGVVADAERRRQWRQAPQGE